MFSLARLTRSIALSPLRQTAPISTLPSISSLKHNNFLVNSASSPCICVQRNIQTCPSSFGLFGGPHDEPMIKRIARKLGWSESSKSYLKACGYLMYIKVADEVKYMNFFNQCNLDDTFMSWFSVVELHLWMLGARVMHEGADGRVVRNAMFQALWEDCDAKSKKLEGALASARRRQIQELGDQFQATLVSYDEGLLSSDAVLAGALWRRLLRRDENLKTPATQEELLRDALSLEMLVLYVRSQYFNLNELGKLQLLRRKFEWAPFDESLFRLVDKVGEKAARKSVL